MYCARWKYIWKFLPFLFSSIFLLPPPLPPPTAFTVPCMSVVSIAATAHLIRPKEKVSRERAGSNYLSLSVFT